MTKKPKVIPFETQLQTREHLQKAIEAQLTLLSDSLAHLHRDYSARRAIYTDEGLKKEHQALLSSLRLLARHLDTCVECVESWFEWTALLFPVVKK
jgi:hypothetical protein